MVSSVARVAVELCQELVASGRREVSDLLKPARQNLDEGHDEQALLLAVQALVHAFRSIVHEKLKVNPICVPSTPRMSKASSGRGAWIARESLKIFREDSKDAGEAHALLLAAYVHVNNHDSTKALKAALASESCFRRFGDRLGEAAALSASTSARLLRGNAGISPQMQLVQDGPSKLKAIKERRDREIKAGLESGRAACAIYSELDEKGLEAMTLNQVAELFLAKDDPDEANNVARESRDICQDLEDVRGEAQALNVILSANMLHEDDFVDALFAAKDALRLFRGGNSKTGKEDKKAIADALHVLAKVHLSIWELKEAEQVVGEALKYYADAGDKTHGVACALQTLAHILACRGSPDEALVASQKSVGIFREARDKYGEALAKASLFYQDLSSRFKIIEERPKEFSEEVTKRIEEDWKVASEALEMMQSLGSQEGEDSLMAMIQEMNLRAEQVQKKLGAPSKTVWTFDRETRTSVCKEYYGPQDSQGK
ncbi:unnamed protein product [Polarella glacialis]|uniref:Uncharacterized protein n=2 Tax=Polarella glacialis TaxID=89957 RepID=A0A813JN57_POLGL|nr:unnamed protein product [Polarella glacialis]